MSPENYSPSTFRPAGTRRPKQMVRLLARLGPQIPIPPPSANASQPISHNLQHLRMRYARPDIFPFPGCCLSGPEDAANSRQVRKTTIGSDRSMKPDDRGG